MRVPLRTKRFNARLSARWFDNECRETADEETKTKVLPFVRGQAELLGFSSSTQLKNRQQNPICSLANGEHDDRSFIACGIALMR